MANSRLGLRTRPGLVRTYTEGGIGGDLDAMAFLNAANITNATIITAINELVFALKYYGIWTKMKSIYPFVGGSASSHRLNLKDARLLDAAFCIIFSGGITHSSTGVLFNGLTGFADTRLNTNSNLVKTSAHLSLYVTNNTNSGSPYDLGNASDLFMTTDSTYLITRYSNNLAYIGIGDNSYGTSTSSTNSQGFWIGATNGGSTQKLYLNGTSIKSATAGSGNLANNNIYIGAANANGTASFFSTKEYAFASIGDGLSDAEAADLYTAVQAFQTTLGRQV